MQDEPKMKPRDSDGLQAALEVEAIQNVMFFGQNIQNPNIHNC